MEMKMEEEGEGEKRGEKREKEGKRGMRERGNDGKVKRW